MLTPSASGDRVEVIDAAGDDDGAAATITSDGHDFVIWGTARAPWRDHCTVTGDEHVAGRFLDALNII